MFECWSNSLGFNLDKLRGHYRGGAGHGGQGGSRGRRALVELGWGLADVGVCGWRWGPTACWGLADDGGSGH